MIRYLVNLEKNGTWIRVGSIDGEGGRDARFSYADAYLEDPSSAAVSVSLPLRKEAFSPQQTRTFFDGLLPEGFTRRAVAAWMRTDEDDYLNPLRAGLRVPGRDPHQPRGGGRGIVVPAALHGGGAGPRRGGGDQIRGAGPAVASVPHGRFGEGRPVS